MKKLVLSVAVLCLSAQLFAQTEPVPEEITAKNSWLKVGLNAGVPLGEAADVSNFTLGVELKGQIMTTNHFGIGLTTGYNHFFPKSGFDNFGTIPAGAFVRYYPRSTGFFAGVDLGYSFITGMPDATGGFYARPQLGYHNYSWNFFAFYNGILRNTDDGGHIQSVGIGTTYNIRFKK